MPQLAICSSTSFFLDKARKAGISHISAGQTLEDWATKQGRL